MSVSTILEPEVIAQVRRVTSLPDLAYEAIRQAVVTGRLKPGEQLRQQALAEELNVSQRTVREAFSRLIAEGLVAHSPYRGVRVATLPPDELVDVYETRALLQGLAVELAAGRLSEQDLARMRELLPLTAMESGSAAEAWTTAREFHLIPIRASGRRHLARLLEQLLDLSNPYSVFHPGQLPEAGTWQQAEYEGHRAILEALEARDGARARALVVGHLRQYLDWVLSGITAAADGRAEHEEGSEDGNAG